MSSFDEKILNAVKSIAQDTDTTNPYEGKWVSILGDFSSAFPGYIPENMTAEDQEGFDDVMTMWWAQLIDKLGAKLCVNCSTEGMMLTNTDSINSAAYDRDENKLSREAGKEYINLDGTKSTSSTKINPDIIIIFLGINDYKANALLGDYSDNLLKSTFPAASTITSTTDISTCYQILLNDIMFTYPNATIYCISPHTLRNTGNYPYFNEASTPWSMPEFEELVRKLCIKFSTRQIALTHYGIRGTSKMIGEGGSLTDETHLSVEAHKMIAKAIYNKMKKFPITWNTRNDVE